MFISERYTQLIVDRFIDAERRLSLLEKSDYLTAKFMVKHAIVYEKHKKEISELYELLNRYAGIILSMQERIRDLENREM